MHITAENYTIKMTPGELLNTAFDIRNVIIHKLKYHWVMHQDVWQSHEKARLRRLKEMSYALGQPDIYEEIYPLADEIFAKYNENKNIDKETDT